MIYQGVPLKNRKNLLFSSVMKCLCFSMRNQYNKKLTRCKQFRLIYDSKILIVNKTKLKESI